ncbi:GSCFA domain-containing protein [Octadecabacter sp.]|nr:GSCFA domain-containing protein [Octadecabacter sp.]
MDIFGRLGTSGVAKVTHDKPLSQAPDVERIKLRFSRRLKRITEVGLLDLQPHQIFPPSQLMEAASLLPDTVELIKSDTPVGSMGSCFAREIRDYLIEADYNYVQHGEGKDAEHGSAPWNRVYNTGCILQELKRAFGHFEPDLIEGTDGRIYDPHRKQASYVSVDEAKTQMAIYSKQAKQAFLDSEVFVFTLGLSEVWYNYHTGSVYAEAPTKIAYDADRDRFKVVSPTENAANLRAALNLLKSKNPNIQIIVTVSPVPLRATFVPRSAMISNNVSKASLLWAAHEIINDLDYVHYFPSYEIVQYMIDDPFAWDFRHMNRDAVAQIMSIFRAAFVT